MREGKEKRAWGLANHHSPGLVSDFALELTILLSDEDGTRFLSMLVGDWMDVIALVFQTFISPYFQFLFLLFHSPFISNSIDDRTLQSN